MSTNEQDLKDLEGSTTEGYKLGEKKTIDELNNLDANDESLVNWKKSLLSNAVDSDPSLPVVELVALRLLSEGLTTPITLDLSPSNITNLKTVNIKEDSDFTVELEFRINRDVVSGLRYIQVVKRAGLKIDKLETMIGSYAPSAAGTSYKKKFPEETSPSGMLARAGTNTVRSRITDDDKLVHADFEWSFKITKEW